MRLIDADKIHPDIRTQKGMLGISQGQLAYAPTINAIPIPEGATNGDVLKRLLYGKAIITEFIHEVNISVNNNVIGQFDMEWWRSPYKRGDTE